MRTPKGGLARTNLVSAVSGVVVGTLLSWFVTLILAPGEVLDAHEEH
jgi:hypothetical protein